MRVLFPVAQNKKLAEAIYDRLVEMGGTPKTDKQHLIMNSTQNYGMVGCLDLHDGLIGNGSIDYIRPESDCVYGDYLKLFTTEEYKVKPIIEVGGYVADISAKGIKVGCVNLTAEKVEELYKAFKECK